MFSTGKNKRRCSQLSEKYIDFMIVQRSQDEQTDSRDNMIYKGTSSDNISNPTQVNYPQVDKLTIKEIVLSKVGSEVENMLTSVETRLQDEVLTALENLVIPSSWSGIGYEVSQCAIRTKC